MAKSFKRDFFIYVVFVKYFIFIAYVFCICVTYLISVLSKFYSNNVSLWDKNPVPMLCREWWKMLHPHSSNVNDCYTNLHKIYGPRWSNILWTLVKKILLLKLRCVINVNFEVLFQEGCRIFWYYSDPSKIVLRFLSSFKESTFFPVYFLLILVKGAIFSIRQISLFLMT